MFLTIGYDTIYSFQDIEDDIKVGVKSMGLITRKNPKFYIGLIYLISLILFSLTFFTIHGATTVCFVTVLIIFFYFFFQIKKIKLEDKDMLQKIFVSNSLFGGLIFLGLII